MAGGLTCHALLVDLLLLAETKERNGTMILIILEIPKV